MLRRFVFIIALALIGTTASAQPLPAPKSLDPALIDTYIEAQVKQKGLVGLSVGIMNDGKMILEKGYGKTAHEKGNAVTPETPFAIGSVTKQFACTAILLLAEDGKLSPHDHVAKYFPNLTSANEITLLDCMNHVSGYTDYYPLDFLDRRMMKAIAGDELLRQYAGTKLDFPPGSKYSYSNTGYILLGRVVEKVSGESFPAFLDKRIFKPLGMKNTQCDPPAGTAGFARGHTSVLLGSTEAAPNEQQGWLHAAGGIYSTAGDLCKWDLALMTGKVLKPDSWKLMTSPRTLTNGKISDYGCGLAIAKMNGEQVLQHSGAVCGFHAYNAFVPRLKSAVVVLCNAEHVDSASLSRDLFQLVLKEHAKTAEAVPVISGPSLRQVCLAMFQDLQAGKIDRTKIGEEFSIYLTDERLKSSAAKLHAFGKPLRAEVDGSSERGGMEASRVRIVCPHGTVKVNVFRSPDGKVQQFLLSE